MFSFLLKKVARTAFACMFLLFLAGTLFVSCDDGDSGHKKKQEPAVVIPSEIAGFWQTEFSTVAGFAYTPASSSFAYCDSFYVDAAAKKAYYYSSSALAEGSYWAGTIVEVVEEEDEDGDLEAVILIVKLTDVEGDWWTEPEKDKFFALAYKNVAGGIVSMAQPYSGEDDAKNTGVATKAEAISEYTVANKYFENFGTYNKRAITPSSLSGMQGTWEDIDEMDWLVRITGNTYLDFMDDWEDRDDIYTSGSDDMLTVMGLIVDCTDTTQDSGVLYVLVLGADVVYDNFNYIAVGWKPGEEDGTITFAVSSEHEDTLAAIQELYSEASDFEDGNYMLDFEKK